MSLLKVNTIRHTSASSDAITLASDGTATAKITNPPPGNRNLIINGAMQVAQRGTTSTSTNYKTVDRYYPDWSGQDEACTQSQHALTSSDTGPWEKGFRYSLHLQNGNQTSGAGAADLAYILYRLEAQDIANCGWDYTSASSYITCSFWVKASVAQTYYGVWSTHDGTSKAYPFSFALSANTWTKVTKSIPGVSGLQFDNNVNHGLDLRLYSFLGTNFTASGVSLDTWANTNWSERTPDMTSTWWTTDDSTFEITGLQLEVGDTATEFEHRSYTDELLRCQRYYYVVVDYTDDGANSGMGLGTYYSNTSFHFYHFLPVEMRVEPTGEIDTTAGNYQIYRNNGADECGDFALTGNTTRRMLDILGEDDVSGTAGDAGLIRVISSPGRMAVTAEL